MIYEFLIPILFISVGLSIIISLSILYLRTASQNINLERLINIARTYRLGNTAALRPFQKHEMENPNDLKSYEDQDLLYEPINIREKVFYPLIICIATIFAFSFTLLASSHIGLYRFPNMILGGALLRGNNPPSVDAYQIGSLEILMFAFLSSYIWALWQLFRRMIDRDVTVYAFHIITIRVITSAIVSITVYQLFRGTAPEAGNMEYFILAAFAIGFFPEVVLRWLSNRALSLFRTGDPSTYLDIEDIEGIDSFVRARLAEAGIFDVALLATSNPITLAVRTPYALTLLVDWVGQAQLLLLIKDVAFKELRERGIRTSIQFYYYLNPQQGTPILSSPSNPTAILSSDPATPSKLTADDARTACTSLNFDPSFKRLNELITKMT